MYPNLWIFLFLFKESYGKTCFTEKSFISNVKQVNYVHRPATNLSEGFTENPKKKKNK